MSASVKQPVALKKRKLSSKQWQQPNTALGQLGENKAVSYLISKRYLIKDRNILYRCGELDIVAFDPNQHELVFFEVKTRSSTTFGHPSLSVNWRKKLAWRQSVGLYLHYYPTSLDIRFDILALTPQGIFHYKNITF